MAEQEGHGKTIGIYIDISGELAPNGAHRMCLVERTRLGKLMLAPIDETCAMTAMLRTVTAQQLEHILRSFYCHSRQNDDESRAG